MRRRAAVVFLALTLVSAGGLASAAAPDTYGWWWKAQQTSDFMLPAPPSVPADGLYVANDPSGPTAVAGLRYASAGSGSAVLQLVVAQGSTSAIADQIVACPTSDAVSGGQAELWAARPEGDCDAGKVPGEASPDGTAVVWKLGSPFEVAPSTWNVVLQPDPESLVPFQVAFDAPAENSFAAARQGTPPPAPTTAPAPAPPASLPTQGDATIGGGSDVPAEFGPPSVPSAETEAAPDPAPVSAPVAASPTPPVERDDLRDRLLAAAIFGAIAISLWFLWMREGTRAALLARILPGRTAPANGDVPERGLGRFVRDRERPPRRLW